MTRPPSSDDTAASSAAVLTAWQDNALPWAKAVRDATIASRTLVTNRAILDAVCALRPVRVLDLGCGEGWLSWHLCRKGMDVVGVDAVASLIQLARHAATPTDTSSPMSPLPPSCTGRFSTAWSAIFLCSMMSVCAPRSVRCRAF